MKEDAEKLLRKVLRRSVEKVISGRATLPVNPGWAMGRWYEPSSAAHTEAFEVKLWGGRPSKKHRKLPRAKQPGSFNEEWQGHAGGGSELVVIFEGNVRIVFGYRDPRDGVVKRISRDASITLRAGDTVVLPDGLFRKFKGGKANSVRGITVRAKG
ncbi:MAG: hypothetical protein JST00_20095 [Deltaproteobacteria bacterium]|nr:hypothetical protein [Deltaproteobacteria bacterium]